MDNGCYLRLKVNGFEAYKIYLAIKLHFLKEDYDYHKFDGHTKATVESFEKRNDKYFFYKIVKNHSSHLVDYFVSNLHNDDRKWIGDLVLSDCNNTYLAWCKKIDGLGYYFNLEIGTLLTKSGHNFDKIFKCKNNQHPILLKMFLAKKISLETLVILERILKFIKRFDKEIKETIIWPRVKHKIMKYNNFVKFNETAFRLKLKEKLISDT